MFSYICLGTNDITRARRFYDSVLAPLGQARVPGYDDATSSAWGTDDPGPHLWVTRPFDGGQAQAANGGMAAFLAPDRAAVAAFHAAGLAAGGRDEGAPGLRPQYGAGFYAAYLRDPDGNKIAAIAYGPLPGDHESPA